jgi:anti-sigma B factor antagonist
MGRTALFSVTVDDVNDTIRVAPRGELDMATVPRFDDVVRACEQEPASTIVVDLHDVTFLDSTGLAALLQARNRSLGNGHRLLFLQASTPVRKVFEISGMGSVLEEHEGTVIPMDLSRDGGRHPTRLGI